MIAREIEKEVLNIANQYPVVLITGARQTGKTILAQRCFPQLRYVNLEDPGQRNAASYDPVGFINSLAEGAVIDEIQKVPSLLSSIQVEVDKTRKPGQFILTGSNQFSLLESVTQSLAGRVGMIKLLPLTIAETKLFECNYSVNDYILNGFYPGIYNNKIEPYKAYRNYYETYIERDLRQIINLKELKKFQLFVRLCAGRIGQIFNASNLSNEVGVSVPTIQNWISVLETSFIVFFLQPWYSNSSKRLVKSPKLYFLDVGLASYLLGNENIRHIETHPLRGSLFDNLVVIELLKHRFNCGLDNNLFFYRDNHQNEVDVLARHGNLFDVYEIKASETFHATFLKGLNYISSIIPDQIKTSNLVYSGSDEYALQETRIVNFCHVKNED
jgi:predicted AAA+ superfamily ATPase